MRTTTLNLYCQYSKSLNLLHNKRKLKLIYILLIVLLNSCGKAQMKFEKEKWNEREDMFYANREKMVADLMNNHLKKGMTSKAVKNLLGSSDNYENIPKNTIIYEIAVDYGWNIDPEKGKTLYIEFEKDSVIKDFKLKEWRN